MPKYRFKTEDGHKLAVNPDRLEFPNDRVASDEAQRALVDMAKKKLPDASRLHIRVAVENEKNEMIYQASLDFRSETREEMRANAVEFTTALINGPPPAKNGH
ncbi:MAG: hypothetical protein EOP19_11460 [Hyphomicrobiales bacterium]|nr:MAG: hypothetical protein EOP19_11460 [Hyphomicrobiales bacterium]